MTTRRPLPFLLLFILPTILLLLGLGAWQVKRLQWKEGLQQTIQEQLAAASVELPESVTKEWEYRRVKIRGELLHDQEIHLYIGARVERGPIGYEILTPLKQKDGRYVLIDRGWVPQEKKDPATRPETLPKGEVTVEGVLRGGEKPGWFTPNNDPVKNLWFWIDLPAIAQHTNLPLAPLIIQQATDKQSKALPIPLQLSDTIHLRNNHLHYAITWFSLALVVMAMAVFYWKKNANKLK